MLVRPSAMLLLPIVLASSACNRPAEPGPAPVAKEQVTARPEAPKAPAPAADPTGMGTPPSRHESDLPDVPLAHPASDNAKQIKASHILIAYKGAQDAGPAVTRSREEAKSLADHVDIQARAGADFSELVAKYSDDPKAKTNHGALGELTRSSMVKPFTDAAFGLMKQEIGYEPVETVFGFHIIKRTE